MYSSPSCLMFFEDVEMESVPSIVHVRVPSFSTNFTLKSS